MADDPGWPLTWKVVRSGLLLPWSLQRQSKREVGNQLIWLRETFLAICIGIGVFTIGVIIALLSSVVAAGGPLLPLVMVAVCGLVSLVAARLVEPELDCAESHSLAETYRRRFFVRIALANPMWFIGFAVALLADAGSAYFLGVASNAVGLVRAAPSRRSLEVEQRKLAASGCSLSLTAALQGQHSAPTV